MAVPGGKPGTCDKACNADCCSVRNTLCYSAGIFSKATGIEIKARHFNLPLLQKHDFQPIFIAKRYKYYRLAIFIWNPS